MRDKSHRYFSQIDFNYQNFIDIYFLGRTFLLSRATVVLYTPTNEHFGIVPVEGMGSGTPVIALKSGENNQINNNLTSIDG